MTTRKTIVITGASDGIGAAAARELSTRGHEVVVVGRSKQKTLAVGGEIGAASFVADFARLDEVRTLAAELNDRYSHIDVLANNAGGVFGDPTKTVDGYEQTFQINHLAPFLLTALLTDKLTESHATVIQTTSHGARFAPTIDVEDLNLDRKFDAVRAYAAAKLKNILFTKELNRRYQSAGISAVCFTPGDVATGFGTQSDSKLMKFIATNRLIRSVMLTTPEKGADQLVWLAESTPGKDWTPGGYYKGRKQLKPPNRQADDETLARALWNKSEELVAASASPS
jgi:NAD(P)-dependent dehydrogenase (short-subunit alcohol dehydrogenase family)